MPSSIQFDPETTAAFWTIGTGILCNTSCAILGCYLVLRRLSLLGDAISHAVLPGIVGAALLSGQVTGLPVFVGAIAVGMLTVFLTQALHTFGNVPEDASMGVVFTSLFALGVILITQFANNLDLDPSCVLYGSIELVPIDTVPVLGFEIPRAVLSLTLVLALTLIFVALLWKELKLAAFDPMLAAAMGFQAGLIYYLLMGMVAVVTVASFEAVGSILVVAMLIVPAATAHLMTDRLRSMMLWAILCGILSAIGGYFGAAHLNTSVAGMMAVIAGALFAAAVVFAPRHGLVTKAASNLRLSMRIIREDLLAELYRLEESRAPLSDPDSMVVFDGTRLYRREGARATLPSASPRKICWKEAARYAGGGLLAWVAIPLLRQRGLIELGPGWTLSLTERGRTRAQSLVRSHRLWEAYLDKHFELPLDHLHEAASRLEHYIGPGLQTKLAAELQTPETDPHGRAIPPLRK